MCINPVFIEEEEEEEEEVENKEEKEEEEVDEKERRFSWRECEREGKGRKKWEREIEITKRKFSKYRNYNFLRCRAQIIPDVCAVALWTEDDIRTFFGLIDCGFVLEFTRQVVLKPQDLLHNGDQLRRILTSKNIGTVVESQKLERALQILHSYWEDQSVIAEYMRREEGVVTVLCEVMGKLGWACF